MRKLHCRILGTLMLCIAIGFVAVALHHPELSFPWNNTVTDLLYTIYSFITLLLFIAPTAKN